MTGTVLDAESIHSLVDRHEEAAISQLTAVLHGTPLCRLEPGTDGSAKHWEGRAAALAQVRRDLRHRSGSEGSAVLADVIVRRLDEWNTQAADLATTAAPAWTSYVAGGVAALGALLEDLLGAAEDSR